MKPIRIKPELLSLLTSIEADSFTTSELTKAYLSIPDCESLSFNVANQFIRRNISRLEKRGMVRRISDADSSLIRFKLTEDFKLGNYQEGSPHCSSKNEVVQKERELRKELRNKLHRYKVELLTAMGEVEEYDSISHQAPIKLALVQDLYDEARDRCSKTLGKIKAIESLISRV